MALGIEMVFEAIDSLSWNNIIYHKDEIYYV